MRERVKIPYKWQIVEAEISNEDLDASQFPDVEGRFVELESYWSFGKKWHFVKPDMDYFWKWTQAPKQFQKRVKRALEIKLRIEGEDLLQTMLEFLFE